MRTLTHDEWHARGRELYGDDPRKWKFRCVSCGNVQSHESVTERNPRVGDTSRWIHRLEVGDGESPVPCFEFADEDA